MIEKSCWFKISTVIRMTRVGEGLRRKRGELSTNINWNEIVKVNHKIKFSNNYLTI